MDGRVVELAIADARPRAIAALVRSFGDLDLAEDLFQEASLRALERWGASGAPKDPTAWLIKVARNAGLDLVRRQRREVSMHAHPAIDSHAMDGDHQADVAERIDREEHKDDVLRLMFMCCHPDLLPHEQLALALKVVAGMSVEEIARAFVIAPEAMQRRLSRAKARAAAALAKPETPGRRERVERLSTVQAMVYLLFNEGYGATRGDEHVRVALCDEAIRLARLLHELFPGETEPMGLLALCLLQHSRRLARADADGALVPLEAQDRTTWDAAMIGEGRRLLETALLRGRPGPYQVQAAIAAVHCAASRPEDTDWAEIERLYEALDQMTPSPVVRLNRAVATSKLRGPGPALHLLEPLAEDLRRYRPFHAVRAALLETLGDADAAVRAIDAALACEPTDQEHAHLRARRSRLSAGPTPLSG